MAVEEPGAAFRERSVQEETTPGSGAWIPAPPLRHILAVAAGGAIGATSRHVFVLAFPRDATAFPLVTFAENVVGSFLLGAVLIALLRAPGRGERWRPFLATGVLGSFTTFSNVTLQVVDLMTMGESTTAGLYLVLSVASGLVAAVVGIVLGASLMDAMRSR